MVSLSWEKEIMSRGHRTVLCIVEGRLAMSMYVSLLAPIDSTGTWILFLPGISLFNKAPITDSAQ